MKKTHKTFLMLAIILVIFFSFYTEISAQIKDYTVLAPLPGTYNETTGTTDLKTYLPGIFKLAISISAVLAFVMITWGGITYATSDGMGQKSNAKEKIENAIYGLVLVIGAWVILNTINPNILKFDLTFPVPEMKASPASIAGGSSAWYPLTPEMLVQDKAIRDDFWNSSAPGGKIHVNTASPCSTQGVVTGCTNLVGLPGNAISGTKQLNKNCNCEIVITGGTEGGHRSHGPGQPILDMGITTQLSNYITTNGGTPVQTSLGPQYTVNKDGVNATFLRESNPPHWHVVFK